MPARSNRRGVLGGGLALFSAGLATESASRPTAPPARADVDPWSDWMLGAAWWSPRLPAIGEIARAEGLRPDDILITQLKSPAQRGSAAHSKTWPRVTFSSAGGGTTTIDPTGVTSPADRDVQAVEAWLLTHG